MSRNLPIIASIVWFIGFFVAPSVHAQGNSDKCTCVSSAALISADEISAALSGNTICGVAGNLKWQEWHSGNKVVELGNSLAGDDVGTWSVAGGNNKNNSTITYNYGSGGSYTYTVCKEGSSYHFCGATNVTSAFVNAGKAKCWQ